MSLQSPAAPTAPPPSAGGVSDRAGPYSPTKAARVAWPLALLFGIGGPVVAAIALWGEAPILGVGIVVGSLGMVGLLGAVEFRGIRGAVAALGFPVGWSVVALVTVLAEWAERSPSQRDEDRAFVAGFFLVMAASSEVGYLTGRLIARLIRRGA